MTTSTPNLTSDLVGISGAIEIANQVIDSGGNLNPNFHIEIHVDVLARYAAARNGEVFEPKKLEGLFENGVARRRGEFKTNSVSLDQARDIHRVLTRLIETGDLTGADQLPGTPLKPVAPLVTLNNIARAWETQIRTPNSPVQDLELAEKLEAIVNLVTTEAHPDNLEMTTPRRRKSDLEISTPLLIHTLERIRDNGDQKEYAQVAEVTDLEFAITKSAVNAYITLSSQHGVSPEVAGLAELYRRGLLPLSILTKNSGVVDQISLITGREPVELCRAIAKVEETHEAQRGEMISSLLEHYDKHLETVKQEKEQRAALILAREAAPIISKPANTKTMATTNDNSRDLELLQEVTALIKSSAVLAEDASWLVNHISTDVLTHPEPLLPNIDGFAQSIEDLSEQFRVDLEPTNIWFTVSYLEGFSNAARAAGKIKNEDDFYLDPHADDSITCYLLIAREVDIFVEAMAAHSTLRSLMIQPNRGTDFTKAVKALGSVINDLDRLHLNTLETLQDVLKLSPNVCDTNRAWRKIAHNPLLARKPNEDQTVIRLDDEQLRHACLLYHTPLPITRALFANEYVGMAWDLTEKQLSERIFEVEALDPTGKVQEVAESLRHSISTAGVETITRGFAVKLKIKNPKSFADYVRPVAQRYDPIFNGESTAIAGIVAPESSRALGDR